MPHLIPIQTARAIAKLEENWSLASVARELHCIFNIKRRWQKNRLARPIRIGVGKVSLLQFTFIYNIPRDRYIAGNFFEQSSHTSVCSKKITRGRQPEGNFERQTRVLDCKEENRPKNFSLGQL
jgi:hypothetical protein